jgi:hypothetical protein
MKNLMEILRTFRTTFLILCFSVNTYAITINLEAAMSSQSSYSQSRVERCLMYAQIAASFCAKQIVAYPQSAVAAGAGLIGSGLALSGQQPGAAVGLMTVGLFAHRPTRKGYYDFFFGTGALYNIARLVGSKFVLGLVTGAELRQQDDFFPDFNGTESDAWKSSAIASASAVNGFVMDNALWKPNRMYFASAGASMASGEFAKAWGLNQVTGNMGDAYGVLLATQINLLFSSQYLSSDDYEQFSNSVPASFGKSLSVMLPGTISGAACATAVVASGLVTKGSYGDRAAKATCGLLAMGIRGGVRYGLNVQYGYEAAMQALTAGFYFDMANRVCMHKLGFAGCYGATTGLFEKTVAPETRYIEMNDFGQ